MFEYWFKVRGVVMSGTHIVVSQTVSPGQLVTPGHVLDYVPRFKQASALNAHCQVFRKKTRERLRQPTTLTVRPGLGVCVPDPRFIANDNGSLGPHQCGDRAFLPRYAHDQLQDYIHAEHGADR